MYDSAQDTINHIEDVEKEILDFMDELMKRALAHDASKLLPPEKSLFDEMTPILKNLIYGSSEYKESLSRLKPALDHHYAVNSHHPEHFKNGIDGMNLYDLIEMYCDWRAATKRNKNGDMKKSLDINRGRFNMSDQLFNIFSNTIKGIKNDL